MPEESSVEVDEIEELVTERLRGIVSEYVGKFSEEDLSKIIKRVITSEGMRVSVNPTFNVPKGEAPIAKFEVQPTFNVPPSQVVVQAPSEGVLKWIALSLERITALLQAVSDGKGMKKVTTVLERDAQGNILKFETKGE